MYCSFSWSVFWFILSPATDSSYWRGDTHAANNESESTGSAVANDFFNDWFIPAVPGNDASPLPDPPGSADGLFVGAESPAPPRPRPCPDRKDADAMGRTSALAWGRAQSRWRVA